MITETADKNKVLSIFIWLKGKVDPPVKGSTGEPNTAPNMAVASYAYTISDGVLAYVGFGDLHNSILPLSRVHFIKVCEMPVST